MDYQSKHSSSGKINTQHNKPFKLKKKIRLKVLYSIMNVMWEKYFSFVYSLLSATVSAM